MAAALAAEAEATAKRRERMAVERIAAAEAAAVNEVRAAAIDIATAASTQLLRDNVRRSGRCDDDRPVDHRRAGGAAPDDLKLRG